MAIPQWALVRIQEAKDRNQNTLSLRCMSGEPLAEIPQDLFHSRKWTKLSFGNNNFTSLPESISKLQNLKVLDLSDNKFTKLPESVAKLRNLEMLDLEGNQLSDLPKAITNLQKLTILNLSRNHFTSLPNFIGELQNLTILNLDENKLASLPDSIAKLQNLIELSLGSSELTSLPECILKLFSLMQLNLSKNHLTGLPEDIVKLQNMTKLDLSKNKITKLPDSLDRLQKLTKLDLQGNGLTSLPESITALHNLTTLILKDNRLISLPESIGNLRHLEALDLSNNAVLSVKVSTSNPDSSYLKMRTAILPKKKFDEVDELGESQFTKLPESIGDLRNLISLNVSHNKLTSLPKTIVKLENLVELILTANPLTTPPPEAAAKGIEGIREYFRQLDEQGQDQLYEAKLLILGESGAGKTTLAKKIEDPNYILQDEKSTAGVDVTTWSFPIEGEKSFRINIWDFGGQEIYHATHQFFLTKRSLYALVADTRKEDTDFYYWLNVVDLLSDNSPLLIVKNEKQDRHRELNERQLRGEFGNLKEVLAVNLSTNRGLDKLKTEIEHYIKNLPHVGSPLPKTWVRVREMLESDHRNYISVEEYLDISKKNGFTQINDSLQLSEYLHDIGVFLHFQDDPLLSKIVILKPKWGTDAVYRVLDNKTVIKNLGRFTRSDLNTIWDVPEYENMRNELLQLMMKFKLCYEIPTQKGIYVAPQLLTENQPEYEWDDQKNLLLRYTYDFMPKGILLQFIVVMSDYIWGQTVWKSGVVLESGGARAEVIEYYGKRQIHVRVSGSNKKALMTIVIHELDKIHKTYKQLKYDKMIPCNCGKCKASETPHFYALERLQKRLADKRDRVECEISYEEVSILGLIDDVMERIPEQEERDSLIIHYHIQGDFVEGDKKMTDNKISISNSTIHGSVVAAESIKDSFNTIEKADIKDDLKEQLKLLTQAVEAMAKELPKAKAEEAAEDMKVLAEQATKEKPNPKWYNVSIDGLMAAAQNLGNVGDAVIELSGKVRKILTGGLL